MWFGLVAASSQRKRGSIPEPTEPVDPPIITNFDEMIYRANISLTGDQGMPRKDQGAITRLQDGRLVVNYNSREGLNDDAPCHCYHAFSSDNGKTWSTPTVLIPDINEGTFNASLHVKSNGDVLCIFGVRESSAPFTSTIRKKVFSPDLSSEVEPMTTILSGGYFPHSAGKIFNDVSRGQLLFPYPVLLSGDGGSETSKYEGKMLVTADEGNTWIDSGLTIEGGLDNGNGGCMEPGITSIGAKLLYYCRTTLGSVWGAEIGRSGTNYLITKTSYDLNLPSMNSQSGIVWVENLKMLAAAHIRLNGDPKLNANRHSIDLTTSFNSTEWNRVMQIYDAPLENAFGVNSPIVYIDYEIQKLIVTWSIIPTQGQTGLHSVTIPFTSLT